jgi:hypothetical protein
MAYFTYRNRPVSKEKFDRSEGIENDDFVGSSPGDYRLSSVLSSDLVGTKFKIMVRWKCGYTVLALISAGNGKFHLKT